MRFQRRLCSTVAALALAAAGLGCTEVAAPRGASVHRSPEQAVAEAAALEAQVRRFLSRHALSEALQAATTCWQLRERYLGPGHTMTLDAIELLGEAHRRRNEWPRAEAAFRTVVAWRSSGLGASHPDTVRAYIALARLLVETCRAAEAEPFAALALGMAEQTRGPADVAVVDPLLVLAEARRQAFDDEAARRHVERAIAVLEPLDAAEQARLRDALGRAAELRRGAGDLAGARALAERRLALAERWSSGDDVVTTAVSVAGLLRSMGDVDAAQEIQRRLGIVTREAPPRPGEVPADAGGGRCRAGQPASTWSAAEASNRAVLGRLQQELGRCFGGRLPEELAAAARIRIHATIGPDGSVEQASAGMSAPRERALVGCFLDHVMGAKLAPPGAGSATILIPIRLE